MKISQDELAQYMIENEITVKDVVDTVIEKNRLIGVGLIGLRDDLNSIVNAHFNCTAAEAVSDTPERVIGLAGLRKVRVSSHGIKLFNASWPGSGLNPERAYWYEFDEHGDLVDTDVPEQDDGPWSAALADDCKTWLFSNVYPTWT